MRVEDEGGFENEVGVVSLSCRGPDCKSSLCSRVYHGCWWNAFLHGESTFLGPLNCMLYRNFQTSLQPQKCIQWKHTQWRRLVYQTSNTTIFFELWHNQYKGEIRKTMRSQWVKKFSVFICWAGWKEPGSTWCIASSIRVKGSHKGSCNMYLVKKSTWFGLTWLRTLIKDLITGATD